MLYQTPSTAVGTGLDRPFPTQTPTGQPNALPSASSQHCIRVKHSTTPTSAILFYQLFLTQQDAKMCIWTRGFCITIFCCEHLDPYLCAYEGMNVPADKHPLSFSPSGCYSPCRAPDCWIDMIIFRSKCVLFYLYFFFPNSYPTEQKDIPLATPGKQLFPEDREERRANRISFPSTAEYSNKNLLLHTPSLPQTCVTLLLIAGLLHATQICHKMGTLQFCRYPTPLYYKNLASFTAQTQEKSKLFTSQVTEQDHSFSIIMDFFLLKFRLAEI